MKVVDGSFLETSGVATVGFTAGLLARMSEVGVATDGLAAGL